MLKREQIRIRDPFVLPDRERGCYFLYGTTALESGSIRANDSFSVYRSTDLEHFEGPKVIFRGSDIGFWADHDFWAPEVHFYNGKYYLFGSCKADGKCRATQILRAFLASFPPRSGSMITTGIPFSYAAFSPSLPA